MGFPGLDALCPHPGDVAPGRRRPHRRGGPGGRRAYRRAGRARRGGSVVERVGRYPAGVDLGPCRAAPAGRAGTGRAARELPAPRRGQRGDRAPRRARPDRSGRRAARHRGHRAAVRRRRGRGGGASGRTPARRVPGLPRPHQRRRPRPARRAPGLRVRPRPAAIRPLCRPRAGPAVRQRLVRRSADRRLAGHRLPAGRPADAEGARRRRGRGRLPRRRRSARP